MLRWTIRLLLLLALAGAGTWIVAGRGAPPAIAISKPDRAIGQRGVFEITVESPVALTELTAVLEQGGRQTPLFSLDNPGDVTVSQPSESQVRITGDIGKERVPDLQSGPARIVVNAARKSIFDLRTLAASAAHDVNVRLEPPRLAIASTHHYVNHGGTEMVMYRVTPPDVASGVRVGTVEYTGYPAGPEVAGADPSLRIAYFALLHDQDLSTPIAVFARDEAGNEVTARFVDQVFPKPFRRSRIQIDDRFLQRVVPEILQRTPELKAPADGDLLPAYLAINGNLRRQNADEIAAITAKTAAAKLWEGPFAQLGNSQVEASFADHRTYLYEGQKIDQQVHLGFDLAVTAAVPIVAANHGTVLNAGWLGIYGNCVIVDHGMGVSSLYAHLSTLDVKPGDAVRKGQVLGRSGMTGLAGGDHLHFTMLVGGHPVNPVEWWDPHWIEDRVTRKLTGLPAGAAVTTP